MPDKNRLEFLALKTERRHKRVTQSHLILKSIVIIITSIFLSFPLLHPFSGDDRSLSLYLRQTLRITNQELTAYAIATFVCSFILFLSFVVYTYLDTREKSALDQLLMDSGENLLNKYHLQVSTRRKRNPVTFSLAISEALKNKVNGTEIDKKKNRERKSKEENGRPEKPPIRKAQKEMIAAYKEYNEMLQFRLNLVNKVRPLASLAIGLYLILVLYLILGFYGNQPVYLLSIFVIPLGIGLLLTLLIYAFLHIKNWFVQVEGKVQAVFLIGVFGVLIAGLQIFR